ncbi:MAG: hypothetical protein KAY37_01530 [Phycisphaerae bacterium]|nr:hypothetical protein [Phycisphaerae bacterium]
MESAANEPSTVRPPPRVVRVLPPPAYWGIRAAVFLFILAPFCLIMTGVSLISLSGLWGSFFALLFAASSLFLLFVARRDAVKQRTRTARVLAQHPDVETDPLVRALRARWGRFNAGLEPKAVKETVQSLDGGAHGSATVVCMGTIEIPIIGERHFEPYIITGTDLWAPKPAAFVVLGAAVTTWYLQRIGVIPWRIIEWSSLVVVLGIVGWGIVGWARKALVRPTYIRLAPGIVQVLEYRTGQRKPAIRNYPMEPGTLVVVSEVYDAYWLFRGEQEDILMIQHLRSRAEVKEHIWWALLSTAPIPTLSDQELIE